MRSAFARASLSASSRKRATWIPTIEIVVYPRVEPTDQFYEVLPLLSGEMASHFRGRGHELHSLREYLTTDSARFVDWKVTREDPAA